MRKSVVLLSLALLCGPVLADEGKARKCVFPDSRERAPAWVCNAHADGWKLTAVGSAAHSAAGTAFMEQMAAADARSRLVRDVRRAVRDKLRIADKDDDAVTKDTLRGVKVLQKVYDANGTLYVLIGMNEASAKKLADSIAAEYRARQQ
ncbi:MAG TPA: hypothetical protein VK149_00935 [Sideroxyarcus sp.]|nr:hypothetical protein [Sideroxyarcus sp.]